jgi:hypothetical protein
VTLFAPQVSGNTGQGTEIDVTVDASGNLGGNLNFLCNNAYRVPNPSVSIDASGAGGPSFTVQAPESCG